MLTFQEFVQIYRTMGEQLDEDAGASPKNPFFMDIVNHVKEIVGKLAKNPKINILDYKTSLGDKGTIYSYFTKHPERHALVMSKVGTPESLNYGQKYEDLINDYRSGKRSKLIKSYGWKILDGSSAWFGIAVRENPQAKKVDGDKTVKRYVTLPPNKLWNGMMNLIDLGKELAKIEPDPEHDSISLKVHWAFRDAISHKDTIVIHFYDPNIKSLIDKAVATWLGTINAQEDDRTSIGRSKFGTDTTKGGSDSQILSNKVFDNIAHNWKNIVGYVQAGDDTKLIGAIGGIINQVSNTAAHRI